MLFKTFQCYNSSLPKRVYSKNIRSYGHSAEQVSCFTIDQFEDVVMCHLKTDDKTISVTYMSPPSSSWPLEATPKNAFQMTSNISWENFLVTDRHSHITAGDSWFLASVR